jgi:hypothetical protein
MVTVQDKKMFCGFPINEQKVNKVFRWPTMEDVV